MQKCFFFLISLLFGFYSSAQRTDITSIEFSLWAPDVSSTQLHGRASIHLLSNSDSVSFDFHPDQINYIRIREGRLKQHLPYSKRKDVLTVKLPPQSPTSKYNVEVDYTLNLSDPFYKELINKEDIPFGLNVQNMLLDKSMGIDGSFFPSIANDLFQYKASITHPEELNSGTNGILEFTVTNSSKTQSQFWSSDEPINPRDFYLILGEFKEFDLDDIEDEYNFTPPDLTALRVQEERNQHKHLIKHLLDHHQHEFEDDFIVQLDSLSELDHNNPILTAQDLANPIPERDWKEQIVLFKKAASDSVKAAQMHFNFHRKHQGAEWADAFLEKKWMELKPLTDSTQVNPHLFKLIASRWLVNSKSLANDRETFLKQLAHINIPPTVDVKYVYRNEKELIFVEQDTSVAAPLNIPFSLYIYTKDSTYHFDAVTANKPTDTLYFPQIGPPQAIRLNFGQHFPGRIQIARSDIYDLYLFSNAEEALEREAALQRLFLTSNPNLFSTVLGIAMDSKDAEMRMLALTKSENLNLPAQYKLKSTLLQLAEKDPVSEIQQKAQKLVEKYYPNK
jgi:hypothetical protein